MPSILVKRAFSFPFGIINIKKFIVLVSLFFLVFTDCNGRDVVYLTGSNLCCYDFQMSRPGHTLNGGNP